MKTLHILLWHKIFHALFICMLLKIDNLLRIIFRTINNFDRNSIYVLTHTRLSKSYTYINASWILNKISKMKTQTKMCMEKIKSKNIWNLRKKQQCWISIHSRSFSLLSLPPSPSHLHLLDPPENYISNSSNRALIADKPTRRSSEFVHLPRVTDRRSSTEREKCDSDKKIHPYHRGALTLPDSDIAGCIRTCLGRTRVFIERRRGNDHVASYRAALKSEESTGFNKMFYHRSEILDLVNQFRSTWCNMVLSIIAFLF